MNSNRTFPITKVAHLFLREFVSPGSTVVDATAGNGHDTLFLAQLVGPTGKVFAFDIQDQALANTANLLAQYQELGEVELIHAGHEMLQFYIQEKISAIVYNLGYLPGSDKTIITKAETTLASLRQALELLAPGGIISLIVYRGHSGGLEEAKILEEFLEQLASPPWHVMRWQKVNGNPHSPYLIFIYH